MQITIVSEFQLFFEMLQLERCKVVNLCCVFWSINNNKTIKFIEEIQLAKAIFKKNHASSFCQSPRAYLKGRDDSDHCAHENLNPQNGPKCVKARSVNFDGFS